VGPRQAGKTTLVRDLIRTEYPARYVTMDDPTVLAGARLDPTTFIADLLEPTIIDEVQRAPDLLLAIKERLDRDQRNGQFLLTGSANIQTLPTIRDALPGRVEYARLWPLAQSEIERGDVNLVDALFVPQLPAEGGWIDRREIARRIAAGGFPSAFSRSYRSRASFFEGYVDSVVGRDVPEIARTRDAANVGRLLRLMAARSASLLSREGLARGIGLDRKTIDHHLRILEDLMLVRLHPAWHTSLSSREVKTPKVFLTDTGMLNALIGASPERILGDQSVTGMAFETFAVMELVKQASWGDTLARLFHYRDHDGREVDAILEGPDGSIVGVEVKSSATASSSDFRSLRFLRDKLGARFRCGVLLYCGAQRVPFGERLYALPLSCLWS
jgi:predicted AAA+ superfamily ATPase